MKVLLLSNIFPPGFIGGYELGAYEVAIGLINSGHDVHVLTSDYFLDDEALCEVTNVTRTLTWATATHELVQPSQLDDIYYNYRNIRELGRLIRTFRPDVVLAFNLMGLGAVSIVTYLQVLKVPLVIYLMDQIFWRLDRKSEMHSQYERLFGAFRLERSTRIVAMSKNVAREVECALGLALSDVTYIPGWVDFSSESEFQSFSTAEDQVRFIFCSRVAPHKGTDIILESVERLVQSGFDNFYLDIYGAGQVAAYMQRVKAKGMDRHIIYKGQVDKKDMLKILSGYDALIFPTWERESFGFVVSEAAVAGCIPIITAGIGASEWFLNGIDSLKISRNATSLYDAMLNVLYLPKDELMRMRSSVSRYARANFDFSRWLPIVENICRSASHCAPIFDQCKQSRAVESAYLYLSTLLRGVLRNEGNA